MDSSQSNVNKNPGEWSKITEDDERSHDKQDNKSNVGEMESAQVQPKVYNGGDGKLPDSSTVTVCLNTPDAILAFEQL